MSNANNSGEEPFVRHRGPITCVAGVPGTRRALTSGYDGAVGIADLHTGRIELLGYHDHLVNRIAVNARGTLAASSGSDYNILLWDLRRGELARVLFGHADDVEDFAFADDRLGISVSRDWRVLVWDIETGAIVRALDGHERDVLSVAYHDGRVYTSGDDMTMRVWDLATGRLERVWGPFQHETDSCAVDPIRGRAILGCDDGAIRVFEIESGALLAEISAHASGIKRVAASPRTGALLSAAYDQRVLIWNPDTFALEGELERRAATWERSLNWSADGRTILAGTFAGTVLEWDAASGRCAAESGSGGSGNACLNDVSANVRGDIVTVSDDGVVRLGQLTASEARWTSERVPDAGNVLMNAVTLNDEYGLVIAGAHDHTLRIWRRTDETLGAEVSVALGEGPINSVRVSHHAGTEGETFAACYSGAIVRVDEEGAIRGKFSAHDGAVKALRLHPREPIGVSCSADGTLVSWRFDGGPLQRYPGHMAIVDDLDIDPAGRRVASVGRDFTLKLHDLESGRLLESRSLGRKSPKGVCFFDDNTVIVTNYWGALFRFDIAAGEMIHAQIAENGISAAVRCGKFVAATSYDGAVYLVDPQNLVVVNSLRAMRQRLCAPSWAPPRAAQVAGASYSP
jgi:toxoflavin biosynthesis protein ToxC